MTIKIKWVASSKFGKAHALVGFDNPVLNRYTYSLCGIRPSRGWERGLAIDYVSGLKPRCKTCEKLAKNTSSKY